MKIKVPIENVNNNKVVNSNPNELEIEVTDDLVILIFEHIQIEVKKEEFINTIKLFT